MSIRVFSLRCANDQCSVKSVCHLMTSVGVIKMCSLAVDMESIPEFVSERDRALSDIGHTIHELCFMLKYAMPVHGGRSSLRFVCKIDYNYVILADVNRRCGQLEVDGQEAASDTIALNTVFNEAFLIILHRTVRTRAESGILLFALIREI